MENSKTFIKYIDLFGIRCSFYNEKMPKLYTVTGGIFSLISILVCILIFIIFSLDDLKRKYPITTISHIPSEGYRKIKFNKEKIWIPWSITDYYNKFVNHSGILFPIIYYYSGIKYNNSYNITKKILNYTLCSQTSMSKINSIYQITVPLNEIYCIEMDDLEIGGSWISEYINFIEFDLYFCEDGISYDENNPKCSSFNKIMNYIGKNNSLEFSVYYPIVQFQPTNKTNPVIVIYREYFYHISKFSNKIERLYLQENVITDDQGWLLTKESNNSYWGLNTKEGDSYSFGKNDDLMNEGSNSRAYSFNIYLEPGIIHYKRYYKKLFIIFSDFFPFAYIIFVVMKNVSKIFKIAENNKKMVELLFENLKEKPNIFEENLQKLRMENSSHNLGRLSFNIFSNKKINDFYSNFKKQKLSVDLNFLKNKINIPHSSIAFNKVLTQNNNELFYNNTTPKKPKKSSSKFFKLHKKSFIENTCNQNLITKNNNIISLDNHPFNFINDLPKISKKKIMIKEKLFPYKYYLCSVFIKNLNISKRRFLFSQRFLKVYSFLCQLFDITTYLSLIREFTALKKIYSQKNISLNKANKKININSTDFIKEINDFIREYK
jgi:hypothetical protein